MSLRLLTPAYALVAKDAGQFCLKICVLHLYLKLYF